MVEVLDLRQFRSAALEPLLRAETAEWSRVLDWDYSASADLIRQYVEARILNGYVLADRVRGRLQPCGYGFFIYEAHKAMIGSIFVAEERRDPAHAQERELLRHILATLRATPALDRIEAQLMPFAPAVLGAGFAEAGFSNYRRVFLERGLGGAPPPRPEPPAEMEIEAWGSLRYEEAAQLILESYQNHIDSRINDQYRTFQGAMRFMHNIAHYPGCGNFDPAASFVARARASGRIEGLVLASRVKPEVAHITQICVLPERQHHGLGRALITHTLGALRASGLRAATLTVTAGNTRAGSLYRQLGFTPLTEFDAYVWEKPETPAAGGQPGVE